MSSDLKPLTNRCPSCGAEGVPLKDLDGLLVCEKCSQKRFSSSVRRRIQQAFERQEAIAKKNAWVKRIHLAKKGVHLYEESKRLEALRIFKEYIGILERHYSVGAGGLSIGLFDPKKDAGEILLISGVFWDMAKICDRIKGQENEMKAYLQKFIEFSVDKPHTILCSETVRKYIKSKHVIHVQDFKNAHTTLRANLSKCFIASAVFGPQADQVFTLRRWKDEKLATSWLGRHFIATYYAISPSVAVFLIQFPWFKRFFQFPLNALSRCLQSLNNRH